MLNVLKFVCVFLCFCKFNYNGKDFTCSTNGSNVYYINNAHSCYLFTAPYHTRGLSYSQPSHKSSQPYQTTPPYDIRSVSVSFVSKIHYRKWFIITYLVRCGVRGAFVRCHILWDMFLYGFVGIALRSKHLLKRVLDND